MVSSEKFSPMRFHQSVKHSLVSVRWPLVSRHPRSMILFRKVRWSIQPSSANPDRCQETTQYAFLWLSSSDRWDEELGNRCGDWHDDRSSLPTQLLPEFAHCLSRCQSSIVVSRAAGWNRLYGRWDTTANLSPVLHRSSFIGCRSDSFGGASSWYCRDESTRFILWRRKVWRTNVTSAIISTFLFLVRRQTVRADVANPWKIRRWTMSNSRFSMSMRI